MAPQPRLAIVATVQQAITALLTTYEPEFLRFGYSLFIAFATILIVWQGVRMMLNQDSLGDHLFEFAKLLIKRKERDEARRHLEKAIVFLQPLGDTVGMRDARALLATLNSK